MTPHSSADQVIMICRHIMPPDVRVMVLLFEGGQHNGGVRRRGDPYQSTTGPSHDATCLLVLSSLAVGS